MIIKPKGTEDILPDEAKKRKYLEEIFSKTAEQFGFSEIKTPTFEYSDLFLKGVGDTTDIVQKQMYTFEKENRSFTLKPEGTTGVIRAVIENKLYAKTLPLKYYYQTNCFRYERNQKGRKKEFSQLGVEVLGSDNPLTDALIIKLADDFFKKVGATNLSLKINSIGCPKCRPEFKKILTEYFSSKKDQLCDTCLNRLEKNPLRILDCKSESCKKVSEDAPKITDHLCSECKDDFSSLKNYLEKFNIDYEVDEGIVRGLDYYTKTCFEFVSNKEDFNKGTILGGGRYDSLVETLGGPELKGVGFALGVERLLIEIEDSLRLDEKEKIMLLNVSENERDFVLKLYAKLLSEGKTVIIDELNRKFKNNLEYANKNNIDKVYIVGEDEVKNNYITEKDMKTGNQSKIKIDEL